ncbi:MAG: NUDIX hydrolase [Ectobacillus sp.]
MAIPRHKLAVAVMVINESNQVLLVKGYVRGWEFPGGYVGENESIKAAAVREVKEESGLDVELTKFFGIDQDIHRSTCIVLFGAKPVGGELKNSEESLAVGYFSIDEAMNRITNQAFKDRLSRCLNEKEYPFVSEI